MAALPIVTSPLSWLNRSELDKLLARGARTDRSPELRRRAAKLTSPRHRRALARDLRRVVVEAGEPHPRRSAAAPLQRKDIRASARHLLDLADLLESAERVSPRGVACVERLLVDDCSPLYRPSVPDSLERAIGAARTGLEAR